MAARDSPAQDRRDAKLCKTDCCELDQEGPLKRADVRGPSPSNACVSKTWIIATIYVLLHSKMWMGVLWSVWHCLLYPGLLAPPGDRLPTHSLAEAQMCDFWQAGISSQNRIQHFLAVLALIGPSSGLLLRKKIYPMETNHRQHCRLKICSYFGWVWQSETSRFV